MARRPSSVIATSLLQLPSSNLYLTKCYKKKAEEGCCRVHAVVAQDRLHENNALAVARDERLEVFVARVLPRRLFGHGVHVARLRGAGRGMHA